MIAFGRNLRSVNDSWITVHKNPKLSKYNKLEFEKHVICFKPSQKDVLFD